MNKFNNSLNNDLSILKYSESISKMGVFKANRKLILYVQKLLIDITNTI